MSYSGQTLVRTIRALGLASLAFSISVAGIIRHDVPEKKYLQLGKQKQFDCVGQLARVDTTGHVVPEGSCVLVNQRYVLSAAHCFIDTDTREDTLDTMIDGKKAQMIWYVQHNPRVTDFSTLCANFGKRRIKVKRGIIHPAYLDSLTKGCCDIALLELEQAVKGIKPAEVNRAFDELHSDVTGVGHGATGCADDPESVKPGHKKIAGQSVVDSVGEPEFGGYKTLLFCWFVSPDNKTGPHASRPLEYITSGGDSGGGLFRQVGNDWELIGICGGGGGGIDLQVLMTTGYYGQKMSWTRMSAFTSWIEEQMK